MSTKRKHQEVDSQDAVHVSRQVQVFGNKPTKKPRRFEPPEHKNQAHASSVNAIKKRMRDVRRRLERAEDLPANVRMEDERALATYEQKLAAAAAEKTRQKMIKKYHMVRFFERQRATRQLKKLRKRLLETESTEEVEELKVQIHVAEVDLNYAQYYPLTEVYVSLYPQRNSTTQDDSGPLAADTSSKPPMWTEVEKCMEDGTLNKLRNRASNTPVSTPRKLERKPAKPKPEAPPVDTFGLNRRERRKLLGASDSTKSKNKSAGFEKNQAGEFKGAKRSMEPGSGDEAESDGGFFEE